MAIFNVETSSVGNIWGVDRWQFDTFGEHVSSSSSSTDAEVFSTSCFSSFALPDEGFCIEDVGDVLYKGSYVPAGIYNDQTYYTGGKGKELYFSTDSRWTLGTRDLVAAYQTDVTHEWISPSALQWTANIYFPGPPPIVWDGTCSSSSSSSSSTDAEDYSTSSDHL